MTFNPAARFGLSHQVLHHLADVLDIETSAVESAVRSHRAQDFADRSNATFARRFRALDHQTRGSHPHDQSMPAPVERNGGFFDSLNTAGKSQFSRLHSQDYQAWSRLKSHKRGPGCFLETSKGYRKTEGVTRWLVDCQESAAISEICDRRTFPIRVIQANLVFADLTAVYPCGL